MLRPLPLTGISLLIIITLLIAYFVLTNIPSTIEAAKRPSQQEPMYSITITDCNKTHALTRNTGETVPDQLQRQISILDAYQNPKAKIDITGFPAQTSKWLPIQPPLESGHYTAKHDQREQEFSCKP